VESRHLFFTQNHIFLSYKIQFKKAQILAWLLPTSRPPFEETNVGMTTLPTRRVKSALPYM
jgi:hypothetical protein